MRNNDDDADDNGDNNDDVALIADQPIGGCVSSTLCKRIIIEVMNETAVCVRYAGISPTSYPRLSLPSEPMIQD